MDVAVRKKCRAPAYGLLFKFVDAYVVVRELPRLADFKGGPKSAPGARVGAWVRTPAQGCNYTIIWQRCALSAVIDFDWSFMHSQVRGRRQRIARSVWRADGGRADANAKGAGGAHFGLA